ncbi:MAG: metalloregulator ArsR/SmtB family transcription factor [Gammaproteobacteria bacterium]|jgi:DNA-binding transcriptional ArsR family regulator|nr:metalloregulator ArsR/SmtB family transcription factor [Gammaproteobacteria bacterium]NBD95399.1 metalloregulator ArsR/SmtB family transcription factor [Gammaproteobacteria bacterium]
MESTIQPNVAEELAPIFAALGQGARLEVMRYLLAAYPRALAAGELQEKLAIPASTLSHHLHRLREVGLVESLRESQWIRYAARADTLQGLLDFLYAECCSRNAVVDSDLAGRCC